MATGVLLTPPIVQLLGNNGQPAVNGSVLTQVGGINTATFQDSGLTTPLPNPIPLNNRGEVSTSNGISSQCFLTPNVVYTFTLFDGPNGTGNQIWSASYVNGVQIAITQILIGPVLYPQTTAEASAGITPSNFIYPSSPASIRRYGAVLDGTTNDRVALVSAIAVAGSNAFTIVIDGPMAIATGITIPSNITIQFIGTGAFKPTTGQTITFNGTVVAQPTQFIFQNATAGLGTISFSANNPKNRTFYFEWWGAKGDSVTDDSAAIIAAMNQVSSAQATIQLAGNYLFASNITQPANVEIVGYGKDFGTQLSPSGSVNWTFSGSSNQCAMRRIAFSAALSTNTNVMVISGGAYRITLEDVWVHNVQSGTNVNGILINTCQACVLNRVTVDGNTAGAAGFTGILVQTGAAGLTLISPDTEVFTNGISITGTAQCDIISPYAERCINGISISGTGRCNIVGGNISVAASDVGIALQTSSSNTTIIGTQFSLGAGATGVTAVGAGPIGASVLGIPSANISDPNKLLVSLTFGAVATGAATPTLASTKPGSNTSTSQWLPIIIGGVTYYIPLWT